PARPPPREPDLPQLRLSRLALALPLLAVRREVVDDFHPHAVGAALEPGLVEQLVGDLDAVRDVVVLHLAGVESEGREVRADGPGRRLAPAEPDVLDDELPVDRIGDRLPDLEVVERGPARVEIELDDRR